jgi:hypothetical protein
MARDVSSRHVIPVQVEPLCIPEPSWLLVSIACTLGLGVLHALHT